MSSKLIKQELDNFEIELLEADEFVTYNELRRNYSSKRQALLYMLKTDNLSYYMSALKEIINEYDSKLD